MAIATYLYKGKKRSVAYIAKALGITPTAMRSRISRANGDMRVALATAPPKPLLMPDGTLVKDFAKKINRSVEYVLSRIGNGMTPTEIAWYSKRDRRRCRTKGNTKCTYYNWHGIELTVQDVSKFTKNSDTTSYRNIMQNGIEFAVSNKKQAAEEQKNVTEQSATSMYPVNPNTRSTRCIEQGTRCDHYDACWDCLIVTKNCFGAKFTQPERRSNITSSLAGLNKHHGCSVMAR